MVIYFGKIFRNAYIELEIPIDCQNITIKITITNYNDRICMRIRRWKRWWKLKFDSRHVVSLTRVWKLDNSRSIIVAGDNENSLNAVYDRII